MNKFKAIFFLLISHSTIIFSNCDRNVLIDIIPHNSVGAEIGVWKGDFSAFLFKHMKPKKLHLIDPWKFIPDYTWEWYGGTIARSQQDMDNIFNLVWHKFSRDPKIEIHRLLAADASSLFEDEYFDWVYIDGDHLYEFVLADLNNYFPKVKTGGLIIGDDFHSLDIQRAVKDFCKNNGIAGYRVVGGNQFIIEKN